jgi:hypothetical protein
VHRTRRILTVRGTKTKRSFRELPLTAAALEALDSLVARLDSPTCSPARKRGRSTCITSAGEWAPAVGDREAGTPVRPPLHIRLERTRRGITVYELARIMGTSVSMIEAHYGALLDTAHETILNRLDAKAVWVQ